MHMKRNTFRTLTSRKLSILIFLVSLIFVAFWTWAFFGINQKIPETHDNLKGYLNPGATIKQKYILQKLILQANHILRYQRSNQKSNGNNLNDASSIEQSGGNVLNAFTVAPYTVETNLLFENERLKILENRRRSRIRGFDDSNNLNANMDYVHEVRSSERRVQYEHDLHRMGVPVVPGIGPDEPHAPRQRLVHLDLKGAPPKLTFLKQLLPVIQSLGATGLLIEYEDMFPYKDSLETLSARNAYKSNELRDFLEFAIRRGLSVIPLVQTFGHFEYALKLKEFQHLREIPESPQSLCPSKIESMAFIEEVLTQVIEFHLNISVALDNNFSHDTSHDNANTSITHVHIGCDEVFRMGSCNECRQRTKHDLFLTHVITISNFVRTKWPNLRVIIWDDMLRDMMLTEMRRSQIGHYVEPMIWVYSNDIYHFIPPHLWDIYAKVFPTAWAASAFKGAFGESLMIPPLQRHLENNMKWLTVIAKEGERFSKGFQGLALTGWQRYDHFAVLCELLPTAMPSLITVLSTVSKGYFSTDPKDNGILKVLQCAFHPESRHSGYAWIELYPNSHHSQLFLTCNYIGSMIFKYILALHDKLEEAQVYLTQVQDKSAWMSTYNVLHNFSSTLRVQELTTNTPSIITDLTNMAKEAHNLLVDVYDEYTIAEIIEQTIYPTIVLLRKQLQNGNALLKTQVWPRRPLMPAQDLFDLDLLPRLQSKETND